MRSFVVAILLFSLVVSGIVFNALYVDSVLSRISDISEQIAKSDSPDGKISELYSLWESSEDILGISIKESKLERMTELIFSLRAASAADNNVELQRLCQLIGELCHEIGRYEKISVQSLI